MNDQINILLFVRKIRLHENIQIIFFKNVYNYVVTIKCEIHNMTFITNLTFKIYIERVKVRREKLLQLHMSISRFLWHDRERDAAQ